MSQPIPASISVICVYNDPVVRQECLDRSLTRHVNAEDPNPSIEYIPVENTSGTYKSAGSALNYGASVAKNDVVVFVHQDVYLHSIDAVIQAACEMERSHFGVMGAIGIRRDGRIVGSVRDRTVLLGDPVAVPTDVDSVDELLFMVPRRLIMHEPLTESPDMAWHAYAVEYGLRVRKLGLRVGVAHIPVTHNSLTNNLARLDVAHVWVAAHYGDILPIRTTCGVVTKKTATGSYRAWFALSSRCRRILIFLAAVRKINKYTVAPLIYADVRFEVDEIISGAPGRRLFIFNNTSGTCFVDDDSPFELKRLGNSVFFSAGEIAKLPLMIDNFPRDAWLLVTNITPQDIRAVKASFVRRDYTVGFHSSIGYWVIVGAEFADLPTRLRKRHLSLRRRLRD
jgi:Glycosyltransferase like family